MKHTTTRRLRGTLGSLAVLGTLPFLLIACSGPSESSTAARADAGAGATWGACMRDAGFDVPDPDDATVASGVTSGPAGVDQAAFSEAAKTCAQRAGVEPASDADHQKWSRQYTQVASCIREHGYPDFPEQKDGGISTMDYPRAQEPAFEETFDECLAEYSPDSQTRSAG